MYEKSAERLKEACKHIQKATTIFNGGPLDYFINDLIGCYELLIERFAPFKADDRVALTKPPVIDSKNHGWYGSRHFLVKGAKGTVRSVHVSRSGFSADVEFDDESWISDVGPDKGKIHKTAPKDRHVYGFHEDYLVSI